MNPRLLCLSLLLPLVACSGSDDDGDDVTMSRDGGQPPATGPLFAVTSEINTGSAYQSYLVVTDDITREQHLDISDGIELPGRARGVGPEGGRVVFTSGDEAPTLTRHDVMDDGTLVEGGTFTFAPAGVQSISEYQSQFYFVNETKAYYFDGATRSIVVWDPQALAISSSIDLSALARTDALLFFSQSPAIEMGTKLYYPAGWLTADRADVLNESAMVVVDTANDSAIVVVDDRCGWARDGVIGDDGMIYLATESYAGAVHHLDSTKAFSPCLIRFDPSSDSYDRSYLVELDEVIDPGTDGDIAGMLVAGENGDAYIRVLDPSLVTPPPVPILVAVRSWWSWWSLSLGDTPTAAPVSGYEPGTGRMVILDVGDLRVIPEAGGEPVVTHLRDVSGGVLGSAGTSIEGQVFSVTKLR